MTELEIELIPDFVYADNRNTNIDNPALINRIMTSESSIDITLQLSEPSMIDVRIYNILGKEINSKVNLYYGAGSHHIHFKPRNMPSGLYIISVMGDNFSEAQKIM